MPRAATDSTSCFLMQILPAKKVRLMRAAALERMSLKEFVLRHALLAAEAVIEKSERPALDEEQIRFMRDLLDNPGRHQLAGMSKVAKQRLVQKLVPHPAVEAFDKALSRMGLPGAM